MKRTIALWALSWLLYFTPCLSQTSSGTEFWLAYMENLTLLFNDDPGPHIFWVYNIQITVPATGYSQPFSVNAGEQIEVLLPNAIWYPETSDIVVGKGIKITADLPIEVMATHFRLYFTESTAVLPETALSDDYLITCFFGTGSLDPPSSFVVVATADGTEVEITPAALTNGLFPAGIPYTVLMDEGDIYQVQALDDLTGSQIRTPNGEKVAVFSGARQSYVGFNCSNPADNHLWEQSQPFSNWSDLYYFVPFKNQGGDYVRILAQGDDTQVFFDCEQETVLQAGDYYDTHINQPTVITSTGPVAVTQFNESQDCNTSGVGDPSMLQLLPTRNQALFARWRATPGTTGSSSSLTQHFANIIMSAEDADVIQLDGNSIENQFFPFPADTSYAYAQVFVSEGDHELISSAPFHVYHYGFGDYDAYTKAGNYQQVESLEFSCEMDCLDLLPVNIVMNPEQCLGQVYTAVLATAAELVTYQWFLDGQAAGINAPVFQDEPVSVGLSTLYLLAADEDGCEYEAAITFNITDCEDDCLGYAIGEITAEGSLCIDSLITFSVETVDPTTDYLWTFDGGQTSSGQSFSTSFSEAGNQTVSLSVINANACMDEASVQLNIDSCMVEDDCLFPPESVQIVEIADLNLCPSDTLFCFFDTELIIQSVLWETDDGRTFTAFSAAIPVIAFGDLEISLTAIDENGCYYYDEATIAAGQDCEDNCQIFVPNAFSPNGDSVNDTFKPFGNCIPDNYNFKLFDRWGGLIFETEDFEEEWDGTLKSRALPSGVFVWLMEYSFPGAGKKLEVGDLVIVR
jgi:gliding motility-associated-like protein